MSEMSYGDITFNSYWKVIYPQVSSGAQYEVFAALWSIIGDAVSQVTEAISNEVEWQLRRELNE